MDAKEFFSRWSKPKARPAQEPADTTGGAATPETIDEAPALPPPTLDEVAALTPQSDFRRFVARGVDENVRRSAMKMLFSDPHFNVMDGLDVYIDDYNKFTPLPAAALAALNHAQALLNPQALLDGSLMRLLDAPEDNHARGDAADSDGQLADHSGAADDTALPPDKPDHDDPIPRL